MNVSLKNRKKVLNISFDELIINIETFVKFDELIINIETFVKYLPSYFEKNFYPCWFILVFMVK